MREYAKIGPKMWHGKTIKDLRKKAEARALEGASKGSEGLVVALYLMTSPSSNMLGLFTQPILYMAHETGLGFEGASKGLQDCIDVGFCSYDPDTEVVWVYEMAKYQVAPSLKASDLRCKGIQREYDALPNCPFLGPFFDFYEQAFNLTEKRDFVPESEAPCIAPSKPLRSQEQEQEQEQEKEQDKNPLSVCTDRVPIQLPKSDPPQKSEIDEIFAYWQKRMDSPRSKLDDKRRKVIKAALKMGYSPADLCRAIRGCSLTPHNMGQNDRGQKYNGIDLIFRNADQIDRFIANDAAPPVGKLAIVNPGDSEAARQAINDEAKRLLFGNRPPQEVINA